MQTGITLNREQKLYVIPSGSGYTCFGFDNAALHHLQMLTQLVSLSMPSRQPGGEGPTLMDKVFQHPLAWKESDWGQVSGYDKYQKVLSLWSQSAASERTYFDPGTHPEVCRILERARKSGVQLRLFLGDTQTGRDWMEENDVVGRIGRSTGQMKVPLLIPKHDIYGSARGLLPWRVQVPCRSRRRTSRPLQEGRLGSRLRCLPDWSRNQRQHTSLVSAEVILTHCAEVKVTHLGEDDGLFGAVDVDPGASSGDTSDGPKGRRGESDRQAVGLLAQHRAAVPA